MPRPLRVFLCHSSNDKPAVRELYQKLRAEPWIEPWLDEEELYPGQDWNMEIEKAVEVADAIIVCLSKGSITKEGYVQRELRTVLDFADYKPEGTLYIIPVRLEECEPPRRLRTWQYADYFEGQRDRAFQRLLVSLKRRADALGLVAEEVERKQIEEQGKRETAEKAAREKLETEAVEKTNREKAEQEAKKKIARQRTPKPKTKKPEEQINSAPAAEELKEEPKKEIPAKPFTKLLDPSSLSPDQNSLVGRVSNPTEPVVPKQRQAKSLTYGFWGIGLLVLILGGFGLNYLFQKLPTFASVIFTPSPQPTKTHISTPTKNFYPNLTPGIGSAMVSEKDGMALLFVPGGIFEMGSNASNSLDENPEHQVNINAFWIDQTEVTNQKYALCVKAGKCNKPLDTTDYQNKDLTNHPVIFVSWNDSKDYCSWAGRRLPTEAEWEKAARGTKGSIYPWGNDLPQEFRLNYDNQLGATSNVSDYPYGISEYRVLDMAGNVWEWVSSLYQPYPYDVTDGREDLISTGQRVLRGGSWKDGNVRSTFRFRLDQDKYSSNIGFRCAKSP